MLAQAIHETCLRRDRLGRAARRARGARLRFGDPTICYRIGPAELAMPMSHMLPIFRCDLESYLRNFSRIIAHVSQEWPKLRVIDVGANVGDTLALIREANPNAIVLCVEGNPAYLRFLSQNAENFGAGVYIEPSYVGRGVAFSGAIVHGGTGGTAHLEKRVGAVPVPTITLEQLLGRHPDFGIPHFIKVDTDGFDAQILEAGMAFLGQHGPLVFAEVDARMAQDAGQNWSGTIRQLADRGYKDSIWWTNQGRMVCRCDLKQTDTIHDLLHFLPGGGDNYSDVLFGRAEHSAIMEAVRDAELNFS
jgi:FkbM family methyltransferase